MKKFLTLAALAWGLTANAAFFYWGVDQSASPNPVAFSFVKISVQGTGVASGTYLVGAGLGETDVAHTGYPDPVTGLVTSPVYSDLGEYAAEAYSFVAELYQETETGDLQLVGVSDAVSYRDAKDRFVYANMNQAGIDPYKYTSFRPVPEPTSGLLVLLGLGALALRRRRVCACAAAAVVGCAALAAPNDTLLSFGTPGHDRYADGSQVLDGECYALVWTPEGEAFGGLTDRAEPVSEKDRLVLVAPLAKFGRCPTTVLEIAAGAAAQYDGGTFGLYLLDTRVRAADGSVGLAPFVDGRPTAVNTLGSAASQEAAAGADQASALRAPAAVKLGAVGVHTEIAAPKITAIRVENATVTLTVEDLSPVADYFVMPSAKPGETAPVLDTAPDANGTFTFPKPEGASFFKVIGVRKF